MSRSQLSKWSSQLVADQPIALLTSSCPLLYLLPPPPSLSLSLLRSHQLLRKLIISFLYWTQDVMAGGAHVWRVHECACVREPRHNDCSAIAEVIKTSADRYQCVDRGSGEIIQPLGICETLEQSCTDTQTKRLRERVGDSTYHSHYF